MGFIEAVPNISEGRNPAVLDALAAAARSVPGAGLLNHSADPAHNRSVYTILGEEAAVAEAAFRLCAKAAELVDMRRHTGEHPCVGAADVVPFIPLSASSMEVCVKLAEDFAARLSADLSIPCILYAKAARAEHRRRLAEIRRGGFSGLQTKLQNPLWTPDTGGAAPHPTAGLTAVGARDILIAFNINLASQNLAAAKQIARRVRASSGGLPHVQALGIPLTDRGIVQVSMNLTGYRVSGLCEVYEAVRGAAELSGIEILGSELIGAAPADALPPDAARVLRLMDFDAARQLLPLG